MSTRVTMSNAAKMTTVLEGKRRNSTESERVAKVARRASAIPAAGKKCLRSKKIRVCVSEDQVTVKKMTSKQFEGWKVLLDDEACGFVKFHPKVDEIFKKHVTVDFAIPKAKRGMHIGRFALRKAIIASIHQLFVAHLRKSNLPSKKALEAVGFEEAKDDSKQLCMIYRKV